MTPSQIKQAEQQAERDAKELAMLLLLIFIRKEGVRTIQGKRYEYDATRGRFRIDGRTVSVRSVRQQLQRIEGRMAARLVKLTNELEQGRRTLAAWQREFERTISSAHILAAAFALGSIRAAANHRVVQERIDEQRKFADDFAEEVRKKKAGSFARIKARAKSYLIAAHITFVNVELELLKGLGWAKEARRRLRNAEHCRDTRTTPGCVELAGKRWTAIEDVVPLGRATCEQWCKCWIEYR